MPHYTAPKYTEDNNAKVNPNDSVSFVAITEAIKVLVISIFGCHFYLCLISMFLDYLLYSFLITSFQIKENIKIIHLIFIY